MFPSARYGAWHKDKKDQTAAKTLPRIICFVVGGSSYSEMSERNNWEVIMGEGCWQLLYKLSN